MQSMFRSSRAVFAAIFSLLLLLAGLSAATAAHAQSGLTIVVDRVDKTGWRAHVEGSCPAGYELRARNLKGTWEEPDDSGATISARCVRPSDGFERWHVTKWVRNPGHVSPTKTPRSHKTPTATPRPHKTPTATPRPHKTPTATPRPHKPTQVPCPGCPVPTATPVLPTATPEVPDVTPVLPTATPEVPTVAPVQPTATPLVPTVAPVQPTATPEVPDVTPEVPTAMPEVPDVTPEVPTATPEVPDVTPETPTATPEQGEAPDAPSGIGPCPNNSNGMPVRWVHRDGRDVPVCEETSGGRAPRPAAAVTGYCFVRDGAAFAHFDVSLTEGEVARAEYVFSDGTREIILDEPFSPDEERAPLPNPLQVAIPSGQSVALHLTVVGYDSLLEVSSNAVDGSCAVSPPRNVAAGGDVIAEQPGDVEAQPAAEAEISERTAASVVEDERAPLPRMLPRTGGELDARRAFWLMYGEVVAAAAIFLIVLGVGLRLALTRRIR